MVFCNDMGWNQKFKHLGHNPYFNRWFSAINLFEIIVFKQKSHNPYFNRWFSAIYMVKMDVIVFKVTILILIDGFLQCCNCKSIPFVG